MYIYEYVGHAGVTRTLEYVSTYISRGSTQESHKKKRQTFAHDNYRYRQTEVARKLQSIFSEQQSFFLITKIKYHRKYKLLTYVYFSVYSKHMH